MISAACCVFDCPGGVPADQVDSGGRLTLFHPFPIGDPARLAEWCNLLMLEADSSFGEMYVCSSHFSPQQYDFSSDCKKPLKSDAVPDKNLPKIMLVEESPKDDRKSSVAQRSTEDRFNPPVLVVDDLGKVCRLCLETDEQGTHASLFAKEDIVEFIRQSIGIELLPNNDSYPQMICQTCIERVTYIHRSREWFHKNDHFLRELVGELSNETALPHPEPLEEDAILPDREPVQDVKMLGAIGLFEGSIEGEEVTLNQLGVTTPEDDSYLSDDEPLSMRMKRSRRTCTKPKQKPKRKPTDARSEMIRQASEAEKINGHYWCRCGAFYLEMKLLSRHIWEDHDIKGLLKTKRQNTRLSQPHVPANPLLLEQMAAVFNGLDREQQ
ncbi:uncharacterized protein LOC109417027 [Aedes albopictus]|uniref:ZAD domain-containing protein n=1 Tax=Aedes albopictus TaxID=7160 RepID=A0ABM1XU93_AEDAL